VQAGGVEGSKFCLFSVALPARCVSSISPSFHYRRLAFCFLPLAAILEFFPCTVAPPYRVSSLLVFLLDNPFLIQLPMQIF
jgi:hypothetical protein